MDTDRYVIRAGEGREVTAITPERAGWTYSGLHVFDLTPEESITVELPVEEALVVPLRGGVSIALNHPTQGEDVLTLTGRPSVFTGPTDTAYLPIGTTAQLTVSAPARIALASSRAGTELPRRVFPAASARVDLRGAGQASRRVTNYTLGTEGVVEHLLVCEVITPGGNWSSYPPHKHEEHSEIERELEEIYYFEMTDGPVGPDGSATPGVAHHRTYSSPGHPIEVLTEVRSGDVALVPHGYHGPCTAPPDIDLYYLNVMAGPATDGIWLATDDPAWAWVRESWPHTPFDPRLAGPHIEEGDR